MPRVSVVIPAFNAEPYIADALASVSAQSFTNLEVIVVDDGSEDRTPELASAHPKTRVLQQPRRGPSAARNAGVNDATGELIAFLDADDAWYPNKLERQLERLAAAPQAILVCTLSQYFDGRLRAPHDLPEGDVTAQLIAENFVATSSVLTRREIYLQAGGLDETMPSSEDYDLWLRLSTIGPFAAVAERLVRYRLRPGSVSFDPVHRTTWTLRALDNLVQRPEAAAHGQAIAQRQAELQYVLGRAQLSLGEREAGRRALESARRADPSYRMACLALEGIARLPSSWLQAAHRLRGWLRGRR